MVKEATRGLRFAAEVDNQPVVVGLEFQKKTHSAALFPRKTAW